MSKMWCFQIET